MKTNRPHAKHWLMERLTALALIPLTIFAVFIFGCLIGKPHAEVIACLASPAIALPLSLFFLLTSKHLSDGLQVIVGDYIHAKPAVIILPILIRAFCWGVGSAAIFALISLMIRNLTTI